MDITEDLADVVAAIWAAPDDDDGGPNAELIDHVVAGIDGGDYRCAEKRDGTWQVCLWAKQALAVYFRRQQIRTHSVGPLMLRDKFPLKLDADRVGYRVAPFGGARYGSYVAPGATLMPSFVNLGSWIGTGSLIDTWVSVGTCVQIGEHVTILPCTSIVGSINPVTALPAIIEDSCYIGSSCVVGAGVRVGQGAVVGHGTVVTTGVPITDLTSPDGGSYVDEIPENAIVAGASVPATGRSDVSVATAAVIGFREAGERAASALARALGEIAR